MFYQQKRPMFYILKEGKPVPTDFAAAAAFLADAEGRTVKQTYLDGLGGTKVRVSTMFLPYVSLWDENGLPLLWETMIFGEGNKELDRSQKRYANEEEARAGHESAVAQVKTLLLCPGA